MTTQTKYLKNITIFFFVLIIAGSLAVCKSTGGATGAENTYEGMSPEGQFVSAATSGDLETMRALLDQGVEIDTMGSINRPALTLASYNGHIDVVKFLIENNADLNLVSGAGEETALIMAVKLEEVEIARLLVTSGADVNIKDAEEKTALDYAKETEQTDLSAFLLEHGAR